LLHLVTGRAERIGFRIFQATDKAAGESDSDDESYQTSRGYAKKEPTLRASPKPRSESSAHRRPRRQRRIHFGPLDMGMSTPRSRSEDRTKEKILVSHLGSLFGRVQTGKAYEVSFCAFAGSRAGEL
jgi:hypothetical protein